MFLIYKKMHGREVLWNTTAGQLKQKEVGNLECQCISCKAYFNVKLNFHLLKRKEYKCQSCVKTGHLNPFYDKHHSEEMKKNHSEFMQGKFTGKDNRFYGKEHSAKTKMILSAKCGKSGEDNGFYGKIHSIETKQILSEKSKQYASKNRDLMSDRAIKAMKNRRYKKTKPEILTENKLVDLQFNFKYNKIIPKVGQFDFIIGDNILLEVNGDYWHANPEVYGKGKRPLNETQQYKVSRDQEKLKLATELGYRIFYIWEQDINNNDWTVLYKIKDIINE